MKKQLLLLLTLCATLSAVAQQSSHPKLPIVRVTQKDGKYGLSDNSGKCLVDNVLDHIKTYYSREYMITVKYNKEYFIVDRKGCIVANAGRALPMTFDQFVVINHNTAVDANGKELFPGKSVSPISLLSGENRFYLFANKPKGDQNSRYQLVTINNEVVSGKLNGYYTPIFSGAIIFSNFQVSQCGVLNSLGDVLVPCKYSSVESFNFNELRYECKLDKTKLPKLYDSHLFSTLGLFVAQRDSYYTIYDQSGTQLTQPKMYKNATEAIKKNFKKAILPHFMRRGYIMQSLQEKINNPNRIRYEEYLAAANRLPIFSSSGKSLSAHIAYLQEHPNVSAYTIAECYTKGKKLYDDDKYQQAIPWLLRAAEGKHYPAYRCLADSYNNSKQFQKAHSWYKKCVKDLTPSSNDYWFACMILGGMYKSGRGCEKNYDTALYYLRLFHQNTTQINKSTASEMIAEVVALKNKATARPQQSASRSSSSSSASSSTSRYSKHSPMPNTLPDDANRYICFKNKSGLIASIRSYFHNGEWKATVFFQVSRSDSHLYGFTKQYVDNTKWVYKGGYAFAYTQEERTNVTLHIALNWSYIKINGHLFDIPISKQEYDNLMPRSRVYMNNGGGYNSNSGSSNSNDSGRSYVDGPCKYCGGGGGCSSCNGRGYKYNPYSGYNDTCPSCNGSGRCFNCRGTGKQATY
ncbi:MAG: sel1 repeat family protein [Rikenellaceae bacterium]|nr:sel1 repeat family protein [Rikenellaceae bacterium]